MVCKTREPCGGRVFRPAGPIATRLNHCSRRGEIRGTIGRYGPAPAGPTEPVGNSRRATGNVPRSGRVVLDTGRFPTAFPRRIDTGSNCCSSGNAEKRPDDSLPAGRTCGGSATLARTQLAQGSADQRMSLHNAMQRSDAQRGKEESLPVKARRGSASRRSGTAGHEICVCVGLARPCENGGTDAVRFRPLHHPTGQSQWPRESPSCWPVQH